jgi:hypothetical protein
LIGPEIAIKVPYASRSENPMAHPGIDARVTGATRAAADDSHATPPGGIQMQTFHCQSCNNPVYFENTFCTQCGHMLGALPDVQVMSALAFAGGDLWQPLAPEVGGRLYRQCRNYAIHQVCNWMVPAERPGDLCDACRFNTTIPNLLRPVNLVRWGRIEAAKRRLIYALMRLELPLPDKHQDPGRGLAFAFLSSEDSPPDEPVMTGHAGGLITLNIDEADAVLREQTRLNMDERYRTLLGHFRHEIGHFYWDLLIRDRPDLLDPFRALFGDERSDYRAALSAHHDSGPPADWQSRFISAYASAHPWEDWAETWAHYLHIVDTLETAASFGLEVERPLPDGGVQRADPDFDPYRIDVVEPLIEHWLPLTFALNSLNRSMGLADLYPFVITPPAIEKLRFVHGVIRAEARAGSDSP